MLITEVEVAEAAMHYKGKNGVGSSHGSGVSILGVVKFISGLTAVTTMGIEFTLSCRFTNYSQVRLPPINYLFPGKY